MRVRPDSHQACPLRALQSTGWLTGRFERCRAGVSQTTCAFRPCRSSRLRRLAPRITLRACCIPQPTLGFVPFPDPDSRPGMGHGDQPCHSRCFCRESFPWDARPFEAFPLYAAIQAERCDRDRDLTLVDARLTGPVAPPDATRLLWDTEARIRAVHGRASPLAVAASPLLHLRRPALSSRQQRRAWRSHSTSGSPATYRSVAPMQRFHHTRARCFHGLSALHTPFPRT